MAVLLLNGTSQRLRTLYDDANVRCTKLLWPGAPDVTHRTKPVAATHSAQQGEGPWLRPEPRCQIWNWGFDHPLLGDQHGSEANVALPLRGQQGRDSGRHRGHGLRRNRFAIPG